MLTFMVLLDLSKAFDSIDHAKMLVKMSSMGMSSLALEWVRSSMHDRQYIRIGSQMFGICKSTHGVPQGSILGPALFNVYVSDLPRIPDCCSLESYVDDFKLHLSFLVKDINGAVQQITEDLRKVAAWCCHNSMTSSRVYIIVISKTQDWNAFYCCSQRLKKLSMKINAIMKDLTDYPPGGTH